MEVLYRKLFLKDLKKLKNQPIYKQIVDLVFTTLPKAATLRDIAGIKAMKKYPNRYRIRIGNYRIGIEVGDNIIEVMRILHRREFYRYFP
ncbi:type II toxin-antitoxin system RelE/ParE family toxin [bacterium]|nr:type II toxin-antitoxin system RelE/ParE family toxin [bacterium]